MILRMMWFSPWAGLSERPRCEGEGVRKSPKCDDSGIMLCAGQMSMVKPNYLLSPASFSGEDFSVMRL